VNRVSVSKCAQCGTDMFAPEWSEHVSDTIYFSLVGGTSMTDSAEARIR
jgi:hypothetical protein